jgi:SAM-dependent methyltransferase
MFRRDADFLDLRRTTPVCANLGRSRGRVIDRLYIEQFLAEHAADVRGHVLDFADDIYVHHFGGSKVTRVDVLHPTKDNPRATIIDDLASGEHIPSDTFDCIICTQVLLFVYDLHAAIRTLYRILKPGGVVLITAPGVAHKIYRVDGAEQFMEHGGDYWRFTTLSLRRLFEEVFPKDHIEVKAYGNVLAAIAFLHGFAVEDLKPEDLEYHDPDFEVSIALRAVKPNQALTT